MTNKPQKAILISDGRFGHKRIVLGIAKSLSLIQNTEFVWLRINEIGKPNRGLQRLKAILGYTFDKLSYAISNDEEDQLPKYKVITSLDDHKIDYVIGAGPRSGPPTIAIARAFRAKSIYFGNPKIPLLKEFDLMIRFAPIWWSRSKTVSHFRPNDIDPIMTEVDELNRPATASFLIGGNKHWNTKTALEFWDLIKFLAQRYKVSVYNSRRTPGIISDEILQSCNRAIAHDPDVASQISFLDCRSSGFNSNLDAYLNDVIVVTADSMSMISEAISARRKVVALVPTGYKIPKGDLDEIRYFLQRDNLLVADSDKARSEIEKLSQVQMMTGNHIEDLAEKLKSALHLN